MVRPLLLTLALGAAPSLPLAAQRLAGQSPDPASEGGVDSSIAPGDDFFAYANGAWLKATVIPEGRVRWGVRDEIAALSRRQVATLLEEARTAAPGTLARKLADFRAAWLDTAAIAAHGLIPLQPALDSIGRLADKAALTRYLARDLGADVDPLNLGVYRSTRPLGLAVEPGIGGEPLNVAFLLQGGLGLGDREPYLAPAPEMQALRTRYLAYLGELLSRVGVSGSPARAEAVLRLETALARAQTSPEASANDHNAEQRWSRADFAERAPGMDWDAFFAIAGLGGEETIVVWQPGAITGLAALVRAEPLAVWQDYLRTRLLDRFADVLPAPFASAALALRGGEARPRPARADEATQSYLGDAVGQVYVARYFPAEWKGRIRTIATGVITAFRARVEQAAWMAPTTRATALTKLDRLYFGLGYPERWPDFGDLTIVADDPIGNLRRLEARNARRTLARLGQPIDRTEWWMTPQTAGAVLLFLQNAYNFPAALLQPTKFDAAASDAANYGAIGAIVGHEASHFVDQLGAEYDADGRWRAWWTPEDRTRYQQLVQPLVEQFSGYRPFPDQAVNGTLTQTENIADLAGLSAAFDAYRRSLGGRAADPAVVRQLDREFFLGFARAWRVKLTDAGLRTQVASNDHAPEQYRIATVRNLDAWYAAFDVRPGQKLYLPPSARVRVW